MLRGAYLVMVSCHGNRAATRLTKLGGSTGTRPSELKEVKKQQIPEICMYRKVTLVSPEYHFSGGSVPREDQGRID